MMSAMSLANLTPHPVRVYGPDTPDRIVDIDEGLLFEVKPAAEPARIAMINLAQAGRAYDEASGLSTWIDWQQFGQCNGLPGPVDGVTYVVALVVARDQTHRTDLIFPMSEVRNARGTVVGCRGFGRVC
jgi:hypothetical protein